MVGAETEMLLRICEALHSSTRMVLQSRVTELPRVSVVRLVMLSPDPAIVVDENTFLGKPSWSNGNMEGMGAGDTVG